MVKGDFPDLCCSFKFSNKKKHFICTLTVLHQWVIQGIHMAVNTILVFLQTSNHTSLVSQQIKFSYAESASNSLVYVPSLKFEFHKE